VYARLPKIHGDESRTRAGTGSSYTVAYGGGANIVNQGVYDAKGDLLLRHSARRPVLDLRRHR
jgi:hypothetical protein